MKRLKHQVHLGLKAVLSPLVFLLPMPIGKPGVFLFSLIFSISNCRLLRTRFPFNVSFFEWHPEQVCKGYRQEIPTSLIVNAGRLIRHCIGQKALII